MQGMPSGKNSEELPAIDIQKHGGLIQQYCGLLNKFPLEDQDLLLIQGIWEIAEWNDELAFWLGAIDDLQGKDINEYSENQAAFLAEYLVLTPEFASQPELNSVELKQGGCNDDVEAVLLCPDQSGFTTVSLDELKQLTGRLCHFCGAPLNDHIQKLQVAMGRLVG